MVNTKANFFKTDTGVPQGDCASTNEFTFYLAKALQNDKNYEHDYTKTITIPTVPSHIIEHNCHQQTDNHTNINLEYADDISIVTSNNEVATRLRKNLPIKFAKRDLTINETKTEIYM